MSYLRIAAGLLLLGASGCRLNTPDYTPPIVQHMHGKASTPLFMLRKRAPLPAKPEEGVFNILDPVTGKYINVDFE
jgi:hypothetical protein